MRTGQESSPCALACRQPVAAMFIDSGFLQSFLVQSPAHAFARGASWLGPDGSPVLSEACGRKRIFPQQAQSYRQVKPPNCCQTQSAEPS